MVDFDFKEVSKNINFNFILPPETNFDFGDINLATEEKYDFDFNFLVSTYFILKSPNNNFTAIWCDPKASLKNGRFYIANEKDLTIINNKNGHPYVEDYYSKTIKGATEEVLTNENIVDIGVSYTDGMTTSTSIASLESIARTTVNNGLRVTSAGKIRTLNR